MSVAHIENAGFWMSLWRRFTGSTPVIEQFAMDTSGRVPAPPMIEAPVWKLAVATAALVQSTPAVSRADARPRQEFMLAARLASTQSLNPPKLRDGKAPVQPREVQPVGAGRKAKPKAPVSAVKRTMPQRHVWLSTRSPVKTAEIVRFAPRTGQQNAKRAA